MLSMSVPHVCSSPLHILLRVLSFISRSPGRLDDEFHFRLERERQTREADELATLRRSALQEEMRKYIELASEAAETASMSAEDARSAIPVSIRLFHRKFRPLVSTTKRRTLDPITSGL